MHYHLMIASSSMGWLSEMSSRVGGNLKHARSASMEQKPCKQLGILAFETAKIMSRLVSLYKALSDDEIHHLRNEVMRSEGVAYLISKDEGFLMSLACAERIEDLDKAATTVARLGQKCKDLGLNKFDLVYTDLKFGIIDFERLDYGSRETEKRVEKMEKLITATSNLYTSSEALSELETSERKLMEWKRKAPMQLQKANFDLFYQKLEHQRKQVRHFREISLWSKTFDKSVSLMAQIVCIIYARICSVFGHYAPMLPLFSLRGLPLPKQGETIWIEPHFPLISPIKEQICSCSWAGKAIAKPGLLHFYSSRACEEIGAEKLSPNSRVFHAAGPSTVGGSGLAIRYANVILLVEKYLHSNALIGYNDRDALYQMLPENLKIAVRSKLSKHMRNVDEDEMLAEGWREALKEIMRWLSPVARNTIKWQLERNVEKMSFDPKQSVLLLQTLHFADKEKTEAAIAEALVSLSCIYRYESHRSCESIRRSNYGEP